MKAILYCRVSTTDQAEKGQSIEAQTERLKAYAKANGYSETEIIGENGISGYKKHRPGYEKVLEAIRNKETDAVIVYSLSRFGRSTLTLLEAVELMKANNVSFHSLSEKIDTSTAAGNFFVTIMAAISELERNQISERTKAVMDYKKSIGECVGNIQFGKKVKYIDKRTNKEISKEAKRNTPKEFVKQLLIDDKEQMKTIALMLKWRAIRVYPYYKGWSLQKICDNLTRYKRRNNNDNILWRPIMVSRILRKWKGWECKFDNQLIKKEEV